MSCTERAFRSAHHAHGAVSALRRELIPSTRGASKDPWRARAWISREGRSIGTGSSVNEAPNRPIDAESTRTGTNGQIPSYWHSNRNLTHFKSALDRPWISRRIPRSSSAVLASTSTPFHQSLPRRSGSVGGIAICQAPSFPRLVAPGWPSVSSRTMLPEPDSAPRLRRSTSDGFSGLECFHPRGVSSKRGESEGFIEVSRKFQNLPPSPLNSVAFRLKFVTPSKMRGDEPKGWSRIFGSDPGRETWDRSFGSDSLTSK